MILELLANPKLDALIQAAAEYLDAKYWIKTQIILETESEQLINLVRQAITTPPRLSMTGGNSKPEPLDLQPLRAEAEKEILPEIKITKTGLCEFCGEPAAPRSTICGKKECKSKRQSRWDAAYREKKRAEKAANPLAETTPIKEEPTPANEAHPFAEVRNNPTWPPAAHFQVQTGPLAGKYLSSWEVIEMLNSGEMDSGTKLLDQQGKTSFGKIAAGRARILVPTAAAN